MSTAVKSKRKFIVVDTSVLIHDPRCLHKFGDNDVIIPIKVIEELDGLKTSKFSAREALRVIEEIRATGDVFLGAPVGNRGGTLRIIPNLSQTFKKHNLEDKPDHRILSVALALSQRGFDERVSMIARGRLNRLPRGIGWELIRSLALVVLVPFYLTLRLLGHNPHNPDNRSVVLVSQDRDFRIMAEGFGIKAQHFTSDRTVVSHHYSGITGIANVTSEFIDEFYREKKIPLPDTGSFYPNQFVNIRNGSQSALAKVSRDRKFLERLQYAERSEARLVDVSPNNTEQLFAVNALLDRSVPLVTLEGKAGTGKTLLALACGLHQVLEEEQYRKVVVSRVTVPMGGRDIGYLPGDVDDKMAPWLKPIFDNLEFILGGWETKKYGSKIKRAMDDKDQVLTPLRMLQDMRKLELVSLSHIRGSTLSGQYIIVDEAQNMTPHEVKTLVTRIGEHSKLVLMGDPDQIDTQYLDKGSNGLVYLIERLKTEAVSAHITLHRGERSELAEVAANKL